MKKTMNMKSIRSNTSSSISKLNQASNLIEEEDNESVSSNSISKDKNEEEENFDNEEDRSLYN